MVQMAANFQKVQDLKLHLAAAMRDRSSDEFQEEKKKKRFCFFMVQR